MCSNDMGLKEEKKNKTDQCLAYNHVKLNSVFAYIHAYFPIQAI